VNTRRLAELFRRHAEISAEIAIALEEPEAANDGAKPRRRQRIARIVPPAEPPSEIVRKAAAENLRQLGYRVPSR
jgi:hypothetical protein